MENLDTYRYEAGFEKFYWDVREIELLGFRLVQNEKKWCRFKGINFEIHVNLANVVPQFNFKALGHCYWLGNFSAILPHKQDFRRLKQYIKGLK